MSCRRVVLSCVGETRAQFAAFRVDQRNRLDDLFAGRLCRRLLLMLMVLVVMVVMPVAIVSGGRLRDNVLLVRE